MNALVDLGHKIGLWFGSQANRLRLKGARVEVIAMLISRNPTPAILLGQSPYYDMWMPPQEGVLLHETFPDALHRCLRDECGVAVPDDETNRRRMFYTRSFRYVGTLDLPTERFGERPVADDAIGTPLEKVKLKRKAYWLATVLVRTPSDLQVQADGIELLKLEWFAPSDARRLIEETNHPPKAALLLSCIDAALKDVQGATKHPRSGA
jgi:hypothetical protein